MTVLTRIDGDVPMLGPSEAAAAISDDATMLMSGFGSVGSPKAVPLALAGSDRDLSLDVVSGGSVGREIDEELVLADAIERRYPYQSQAASRSAVNGGTIAFQDYHISSMGDAVEYGDWIDANVAVVEALAVGPDWLIPTTSIGQTPAYVAAADQVIVEVNTAVPLDVQQIHDVYRRAEPPNREAIPLSKPGGRIGEPTIQFRSENLVGVVETHELDSGYEFRKPTEADKRIAGNLGTFLTEEMAANPLFSEGLSIQLGVGSIGNALMMELSEIDFGDRSVAYFGEVIQDGLLDMIEADVIEVASATSLALSEPGQKRFFDDVDAYADDVVLRPSSISNNADLIDRFGVVGVNSALEVDLYGHANSTHVHGTDIVNGIGGGGDFTRNSPVSIITLPSTAASGSVSRIVPMVPHVDHTEHDVSIVITDQGVADLRGRSPSERARVLIESCAHPDYRDDLRSYLDGAETVGGHICHDLEDALSWHQRWRS